MARRTLGDSRVRELVSRLVALYLRTGSMNALTDVLTGALPKGAAVGRLYPNRLHSLLSADPNRSINDGTLDTIEAAVRQLEAKGFAGDADGAARVRAAVLDRAQEMELMQLAEPLRVRAASGLAEELGTPLAVVLAILEEDTHVAFPASPTQVRDTAGGAALPGPDWSFQDIAYERCRAALRKGAGRKVGLILPTGGGKTRVALRIVLGELADASDPNAIVLWITHRKRLAAQARDELQEMIVSGTPELPDNAVSLLAHRVEFILISRLDEALARPGQHLLLVVVDEAHHAAAPSYRAIFDTAPSVRGLFLTATPRRRDERYIGIDEIAYSITYRQLFEKGALVEPTFEAPLVIPPSAWDDPNGLEDLADFVLDRAEREFVKTLVVASTIEKVLSLYAALDRALADRPEHILNSSDLGWVHASASSAGINPDAFLDEFETRKRGILVATNGLLGEGFDDRRINAVVITYPSTSLVQLMQAAGRCLRYYPTKRGAYVVQVKESNLAYHFEQRWLYKEISDVLHPQLVDKEYSSRDDLRGQVESLLDSRRVREEVRSSVLNQLTKVVEGESCSLLLTGLPLEGSSAVNFEEKAPWSAILETAANSDFFREIFNEFCARDTEVEVKDLDAFLRTYVSRDMTPGSEWQTYMNMLLAMQYARREIRNEPYEGRENRPYVPSRGTTWLTYVTFAYQPAIPEALRNFLATCVNRERVITDYLAHKDEWSLVVRLPLPLGGAVAYLLNHEQATQFQRMRQELTGLIRVATGEDSFRVLAGWLATIPTASIPMPVLQRLENFLSEEAHNRDTFPLGARSAVAVSSIGIRSPAAVH